MSNHKKTKLVWMIALKSCKGHRSGKTLRWLQQRPYTKTDRFRMIMEISALLNDSFVDYTWLLYWGTLSPCGLGNL